MNRFKWVIAGAIVITSFLNIVSANDIVVNVEGGNNVNESSLQLLVTANLVRDGSDDNSVSLPFVTEFSISSNESASAGLDYIVTSGILNWAAGESGSKSFTVSIVDDAIKETTESFDIVFSSPVNSTVNLNNSNLRIQINIIDNDIVASESISSSPQAAIVETINVYCADADVNQSADFVQLCQLLDTETSAENLERALRVISPASTVSQMRIGQQIQRQQLNSVGSRLTAIRSNTNSSRPLSLLSFSVNGYALPSQAMANNNEFSGLLGKRFDVFFSGNYSYGERKETQNEIGFKPVQYGVMSGVDYRVTNQIIVGGAIGLANTQAKLSSGSGDVTANGYDLIFYAVLFKKKNAYFEFVGSHGIYQYKLNRNINFLLSGNLISESAKSETKSSQQSLGFSGGYDYRSSWGSNFGLNARLTRAESVLKSYQETGANIYNLAINEQSSSSVTSNITLFLSHPFSFSRAVIIPQVSMSGVHEFTKGADSVSGFLVTNKEIGKFNFLTSELDRDYANLRFAVSAVLTGGISLFFSYETLLAYDNYQNHQFSFGGRIESPF